MRTHTHTTATTTTSQGLTDRQESWVSLGSAPNWLCDLWDSFWTSVSPPVTMKVIIDLGTLSGSYSLEFDFLSLSLSFLLSN